MVGSIAGSLTESDSCSLAVNSTVGWAPGLPCLALLSGCPSLPPVSAVQALSLHCVWCNAAAPAAISFGRPLLQHHSSVRTGCGVLGSCAACYSACTARACSSASSPPAATPLPHVVQVECHALKGQVSWRDGQVGSCRCCCAVCATGLAQHAQHAPRPSCSCLLLFPAALHAVLSVCGPLVLSTCRAFPSLPKAPFKFTSCFPCVPTPM